jgi:hypothetical protein
MAAVGTGLAYATGRAVNAQAHSNAHYLLVAGIRDYLQQVTACNEGSMPVCLGKDKSHCNTCSGVDACVEVTLSCETTTVDVNGTLVPLKRLVSVATTPDDPAAVALFGGDGYVRISLD